MIEKIKKMHNKFNLTSIKFTDEEKKFRIICMQEELDEYKEALNSADELDALVDLVVFTLGTVDRHGLSNIFEEAYNRVMESNMSKIIGPNQKRDNFQLDLFKPEGFEPANLDDIV